MSYTGIRVGRTSVADGGTITHGLGVVPKAAQVTGTNAGTIATVTSITATTMVVALKAASLTTAASGSQIVNWLVAE